MPALIRVKRSSSVEEDNDAKRRDRASALTRVRKRFEREGGQGRAGRNS